MSCSATHGCRAAGNTSQPSVASVPTALLCALLATGCELGPIPFTCTTDADCVAEGAAGRCEPTGDCSFEDAACVAGFRYGEHSAEALRGRCATCLSAVVVGDDHGCVLTSDGRVACWGANDADQRGPTDVVLSGVAQLAAGGAHNCTIMSDSGKIRCWGANESGQCGTDPMLATTPPIDVLSRDGSPLQKALSISAGATHSCALAGTAAVCWGNNDDGQLGRDCNTGSLCHEAQAAALPAEEPSMVAAGGHASCARLDDEIYCWGDNTSFQLTLMGDSFARPAQVPQLGDIDGAIVMGDRAACGLAGEEVKCWGTLESGPTPPLPISGILAPSELVVGRAHACALMDGAVQCWGRGDEGQLGEEALAPIPLSAPARDIGAGGDSSCAITSDGRVQCWGRGHVLGAADAQSAAPVTVFDDAVLCQ